MGEGLGDRLRCSRMVALAEHARLDGWTRFSEAALGGPIAAVREGDVIRIDVTQQLLEVEISDAEIKHRMAHWKAPKPLFATGVFAKYAALAASASEGAITKPQ